MSVFFLIYFRKYEKWGGKEIQKQCYSENYENTHISADTLAEKKTTLLVQTNILFELKWSILFHFDVFCLLLKYPLI